MTLYELDLHVQGYRRRLENQHELLAWGCANLMTMWAKKGHSVTVDKLMGREERVDPRELKRRLDAEAKRLRTGKRDRLEEARAPTVYDRDADQAAMDAYLDRILREAEADDDGDTLDAEEV